jgi:hypothetical protein
MCPGGMNSFPQRRTDREDDVFIDKSKFTGSHQIKFWPGSSYCEPVSGIAFTSAHIIRFFWVQCPSGWDVAYIMYQRFNCLFTLSVVLITIALAHAWPPTSVHPFQQHQAYRSSATTTIQNTLKTSNQRTSNVRESNFGLCQFLPDI